MPRPISDEELQLKKRARRRLVGAIVLVSAVAVILPMVLDSEPRAVTQNVDIQIPSSDSRELKPKASPQSPPPVVATSKPIKGMPLASDAPAKEAAPAAATETPAAAKGGDTAEAKPAPAEAPKAEVKQPPKEAPKAAAREPAKGQHKETAKTDGASASGPYVVQVAALADAARVRQLQKQMSAAGVKTYTEAISTKSGEITRVRAGPYATREAAESARSQLRKAGLDGKVVPK